MIFGIDLPFLSCDTRGKLKIFSMNLKLLLFLLNAVLKVHDESARTTPHGQVVPRVAFLENPSRLHRRTLQARKQSAPSSHFQLVIYRVKLSYSVRGLHCPDPAREPASCSDSAPPRPRGKVLTAAVLTPLNTDIHNLSRTPVDACGLLHGPPAKPWLQT